jgi:endonuclease/exonuclease/phosphatase family metal-dependent hydrolase
MNETTEKKYSFPHRFFWLLNLAVAAGLLFSYMAGSISPADIWWLALFGLGFGTFFVLNLICIAVWRWRKSRKYWLSLILCILGIGNLFDIVEPSLFRSHAPDPDRNVEPVKLMSFNVRLFDLYNWFHSSETRGNIFSFLKEENPAIACFQEFYTNTGEKSEMKNKEELTRVLGAPYSHIEFTVSLNGKDNFGIATYSKYPIVRRGAHHFKKKGGNVFIYSDIKIGDDTLRVFNVHLESIRFRKEDYKFIENLGNDEVEQDELAGGLNILRRLKRAYQKRAEQVDLIYHEIRKSPYRVVVCGDFNDTPSSYAVNTLSENLKDSFRESGVGFGKTYSGPFPSFRIDYIFHDKQLKSFNFTTHHGELSDHYPISCQLSWKRPGL